MSSLNAKHLRDELKSYGVPEGNIRLFGQQVPKPDIQEYLTLNALRRSDNPAPDGVAEHQGRALLYFVDEQRLRKSPPSSTGNLFTAGDSPQLPQIFKQLACRGERAYLARIELGRLLVAPINLTDKQPNWVEYKPDSTEGKTLFSRLAFGLADGEDFAGGDAVFDRLFDLLKHAANSIAKTEELRPDALSLVGRALFFRFLRDRGVLDGYPVTRIAPDAFDWQDCFANPKNSADTCSWLDRTFNGDFLSLSDNGSESFFRRVGQLTDASVFRHLTAVIRGHQPFGNDYQPLLNWNWQEFDFAQIPVGLLSQVYEAFSWEWTPKEAKRTSQRYTPRNIAITLLDEVFHGHPDITKCRLLDPACGAGVFLVLAFRRLYLERWKASPRKDRPGTVEIRQILEQQIVGFDISDAALKLAALSLYLTAVELDPKPQPPDKLKFKNLRSHVLHNVREEDAPKDGAALGSLGAHLGKKFDSDFDVIVSNPPWTSVDEGLGQKFEAECRKIIKSVTGKTSNFKLPDNNPDLPFLLKSLKWCKPGGRIAMALPARILLKNEPTPAGARNELFKILQIDGIINGTNLSDTPVWPKMNQPWMLLFATNSVPPPNQRTNLVTLPLDSSLNKSGHFRIDSESARPIDLQTASEKPWLWKTLSIGTSLDVEIIDKIRRSASEPLEEYWKRFVGAYRHGKGYIRGKVEERTRDAGHLKGLPNLNSTDLFKFVVDPSELETFRFDKLQWPRRISIYEPPLVLIKESPGQDRREGRGLLSHHKIAYNESFSGYSAAGHKHGDLLVKYIHLFIHSDVWLYYLLVTSPQFGAERRRFHKADLERCPIPTFENLTDVDKKEVVSLSKQLVLGRHDVWTGIDNFFVRLYGLRPNDTQTIHDTLSVGLPYETERHRACNPPSSNDVERFKASLSDALNPFLKKFGGTSVTTVMSPSAGTAFGVLLITNKHGSSEGNHLPSGLLERLTSLADETGATQLILTESPRVYIGIYGQYRYWTQSRARLLAGDIIRTYLDVITG